MDGKVNEAIIKEISIYSKKSMVRLVLGILLAFVVTIAIWV